MLVNGTLLLLLQALLAAALIRVALLDTWTAHHTWKSKAEFSSHSLLHPILCNSPNPGGA
jgi:hypothetical protein